MSTQDESAPVLVVDDDPDLRRAIHWALEDEGLLVAEAADGEEAVRAGTASRPALVVLDISLPGLGGAAVAQRLRSAHDDTIPIIVITADGRAGEKAQSIGALAYLHKPFELDDLVLAVRRGLR